MKKRYVIISLLMALILLIGGCGSSSDKTTGSDKTSTGSENESAAQSASRDIFAMDTYMTITCYGEKCEEAADAAVEEIKRLDNLLSIGNEESDIYKINAAGEGSLNEDEQTIMEMALDIYDECSGAFDVTILPLMELWGFTTKDYRVPSQEEIAECLKMLGSDQLEYSDGYVKLAAGQGIDFGGIAKGYTSDRLMEIFADYGLTSAKISLGGNAQVYGRKVDGSLYKFGIVDPFDPDNKSHYMGVLKGEDCCVITSGAYERNFVGDDGVTYHHIIDPATGMPANSGLISVSIVCDSGIIADGLSTALYVMGLEKSIEYWKTSKYDFDMILMDEDGEIYITEGIKDNFSSNYYNVNVITK